MERVQATLPRRAKRKLGARSRRLDRAERAKILRAQNLLVKRHSSRLTGEAGTSI
jgi:hypothetical protein